MAPEARPASIVRRIAVSGGGTVYVADTGQDTIRAIGPGAVVTTLVSFRGRAGFEHELAGVAVDAAGLIYASVGSEQFMTVLFAGGRHEIFTVTGDGTVATLAGGEGRCAILCWPSGLAVDHSGNLYVTNSGSFASRGGGSSIAQGVAGGSPPPEPPSGLSIASIVGNIVTLRWNPPASGAVPFGYELEAGTTPGGIVAAWTTGNRLLVHTVIAPTGIFFVGIRTVAGPARSEPSNEVRVAVGVEELPSPPADLTAAVNGTAQSLSWRNTHHGGTVSSVVLEVFGTTRASIPLGLTDRVRFPVVPFGTYLVAVRAANGAGSSGPSNVVPLSIPAACAGPPHPPDHFMASLSDDVLSLFWDPASSGGATAHYVVELMQPVELVALTAERSITVDSLRRVCAPPAGGQ